MGVGIEMIVELIYKYVGQFVFFDVMLLMVFSWKVCFSVYVREMVSGLCFGIFIVKVWCDNSEYE